MVYIAKKVSLFTPQRVYGLCLNTIVRDVLTHLPVACLFCPFRHENRRTLEI